MQKFALNFICKNESHIISRMLDSTKPITDLIVAVDTGSSDNTIAIIEDYGKKHHIPTYVFQRPFDNFANSRNHAICKLKEVVEDLAWDAHSTWGFCIDCDGIMRIDNWFDKAVVSCDYYFVYCFVGEMKYTKTLFYRLDLDFLWEGPIHEFMVNRNQPYSKAIIAGIQIKYDTKGASWKGDLEAKFINYVRLLKAYVHDGNNRFRWVYYIGESYFEAANVSKSKERKKTYLLEALSFYKEALALDSEIRHERYRACERIALVKLDLKEDWEHVRDALLTAYTIDKRYAEPFFHLIDHYIKSGQWQVAYLFSSFAVANYHGSIPGDSDMVEMTESLYQWKLLFLHSVICINSGRVEEAKPSHSALLRIIKERPRYFKKSDIVLIRLSSPTLTSILRRLERFYFRLNFLSK